MRSRHLILSIITILIVVACNQSEKPKTREMENWARQNYEYALYMHKSGKLDSAYYYYQNTLNATRDSLLKAKTYNGIALVQYDVGDYFGAQESIGFSSSSLNPSDRAHDSCQLSNYTVLGNASFNLKDYDEAIRYYDQALAFRHLKDYLLNILNGKAMALQKKGELNAAVHLLDSILKEGISDTIVKVRIICNKARVMWLVDSAYNPMSEYREAIRLRFAVQHTDYSGLITSFGNLSEYYAKSKIDSALFYAHKMYEYASYVRSADDRKDALKKLSELSAPATAINYLSEYVELGDSIQTARNNAKNQFALIRFESEKNKADNFRLQRDIAKQRRILLATIIATALIILISIIAYRKKRARLRREAEIRIRENKLKTSQKVHDVVANGLYRIMNDLEHNEDIDKEEILDKVEVLYEQSRDISYEDQEKEDTISAQTIANMIASFANEKTKVLVTGKLDAVNGLSFPVRAQLMHVLEELMINMQKHSRAKNVVVKFGREGGKLTVDYKDDGIGFDEKRNFGNGLKSTVNRISSIRGEINFERDENDGSRIKIRIPEEK